MTVGEFIRPDTRRIFVAIASALIFFNTYHLLGFIPCITGNTSCIIAWSSMAVLSFFLLEFYYLLWGVLFYPFACSLVALYEARTDIRTLKNRMAVVIGIVFFNPFVIFILVTMTAVWMVFG
jgi:hypothetical protein